MSASTPPAIPSPTSIPEDETDTLWLYPPSLALAILATVLYGILFIVLVYQTLFQHHSAGSGVGKARKPAWFFSPVLIGAVLEVAGYALRSYVVKDQDQLTPYILTLTFVVMAPVFIAAGIYMLVTRLAFLLLLPPTSPSNPHSNSNSIHTSSPSPHTLGKPSPEKPLTIFRLPIRSLTPLFVTCDIFTCLVQASGSAIASSDNWVGPNAETGSNVLIGGLALQAVTFGFFLCVFGRMHFLALRNASVGDDMVPGWRRFVVAVEVSAGLIMLRCIYRVAEFAEGIDGYAFLHEWMFYVFESLPMLIALGTLAVFHPARFLGADGGMGRIKTEMEARGMEWGSGRRCLCFGRRRSKKENEGMDA